ncbi:hypothetical protein [Parvibaculum sp.]|uniref:hypothetical protein n=1 Tax=Parvibaculum sp. TaxID=2024848 RepID=UPI002736AA55|nr:hypothetical protein [Parvibaculum sp.]MDP3328737.1 hypothetical protein [Parvibaculum sp.]
MDDDLRVRVAEAIGSALWSGNEREVWPGFHDCTVTLRAALLAAADAAIIERDRTVRFEVEPGRISDADLRTIMGFHREAVDIVWGAGAHIEGVTFVEALSLSDFNPENEVVTEFRAGATYWTGDGPRLRTSGPRYEL